MRPAASEAAAPLREAWYYALPSRRLRRRAAGAKLMLGEPILIGRNSPGTPFALRDLCPHRGMPPRAGLLERAYRAGPMGDWAWPGGLADPRRTIHVGSASRVSTMRRHPARRTTRAFSLLRGAPETEIILRLPSLRIEQVRAGKGR